MDFTDKQKRIINEISSKYSLELLFLFGSQVDGNTHKESDFDVAYKARYDLDLMEEARLSLDLSSVFRSENIDLLNLKKASPLLLYASTKKAKVMFEKTPITFAELRCYAFKLYLETKPLYELSFKRLQNSLTLN